jgi:hypothetical protein
MLNSQILPSIHESVSQTGNNEQENQEQGGKSRETSPIINHLQMQLKARQADDD